MRFDELLDNEDMLDALWDMRFDECTPIQEKAVPAILEGHNLLACAQTGTGKTAAYLLPIIDMLSANSKPDKINCVVMVPTRELAQQIDRQLEGFSYYLDVSGIPIYGGTDGITFESQRQALKRGADIVIATPGRLLAHIKMGYVDLSEVSFFVLDEADRMLDMGFHEDIMNIRKELPDDCQTLLFSATMPPKIKQLAKEILKDPIEIKLSVSKPAEKISQVVYPVAERDKIKLLKYIFSNQPPQRAILFSSSKQKVKDLCRELKSKNFVVSEMHSDLDQSLRDDTMLKFKAGRINLLVATDILSRGIDVDDIELVVNFDVPHDAEEYVHRVGRTARADKEGRAITFVSEKDSRKLASIERLVKKQIEKKEVPSEVGRTLELSHRHQRNGATEKQKSRQRKFSASQSKTEGKNRNFQNKRSRKPSQKKSASQNSNQ